MAITITGTVHDEIQDGLGNLKKIKIGVTAIDSVTKKRVYKEMVFSIGQPVVSADILPFSYFTTTPTKAEVKAKVLEWLNFDAAGKTILQEMQDETQVDKQIISLQQGDPNSLVGEVM
jgi:hypothetical protein